MRLDWAAGLAMAIALPLAAGAEVTYGETPRTTALEFKLGGYKPMINREAGLGGTNPYDEAFGAAAMLLFELEGDRQLFQKFGSLGVGLSIGYGEKFGRARAVDGGAPAADATGLRLVPIKLLGVYRFDWAALKHSIPVVPYAKLGLAATPWWVVKGASIEESGGLRGEGTKLGWAGVLGVSLLLDFFEPRLARDMDSTSGINHSYLFAEYVHQDVNDFGGGGLDLSSRHWMFGLTLEY